MEKKVLVVDDDESILEAIAFILEDDGYIVETSIKGEETYKKVEKFKPDVIILDVLMSGSDGRTICKKLKADEATKDIPIIMISAHPTAKDSVLQVGADAFLPKPFATAKLLAFVDEFS